MKYYNKLTLMMCLAVGFVGAQRIVIAIIMPAIVQEMKLSYTEVGLIMSVTGLVWAVATFFWSGLGDRFGRKPVIVFCTILAAILSWTTGFVHSLGAMLTVRGTLGLFEGGVTPSAVSTVTEVSPPQKRAMNAGLVMGSFMLIGMFIGPLVAVWTLTKFGSWRPVFWVISLPFLVIGIVTIFVMKESPAVAENIKRRKEGKTIEDKPKVKLIDALKYKNVLLATITSIPAMAYFIVYVSFSSLFLARIHHFDMGAIGMIMGASGVGGFLGESSLGALADFIGRKATLVIAAVLTFVFGAVIACMPVGTSVLAFTILFFVWTWIGFGMFPIYMATVPSESVPREISGTAVGIPQGVGELLGSAVMPTVAGIVADRFGLFAPIWMAAVAALIVGVVALFYIETAPRRLARMKTPPTPEDHLFKRFRPVKELAAAQK
jgi:MFS family permease